MPFEMDSTISIHAPRKGGDDGNGRSCEGYWYISIHAPPRGGRQIDGHIYIAQDVDFNPRPPARGATKRYLPLRRDS